MITVEGNSGNFLSTLPTGPGIYKFINRKNKLIYVGKAINIKKRVRSYFSNKKNIPKKTIKLVQDTGYIDFILTDTEYDALLLENNLIKQNQPKYNILLKDDKTYPFIHIPNESFPRIIITRKLNQKKGGEYFGPFTNVTAMKNVLELIKKTYTIRTCKYTLSPNNIAERKFKVCLEYHIGNCLGPCVGLQNETDYTNDINQIIHILKGNLSMVKDYFQSKMNEAAENWKFEEAQKYKDKISLLTKFNSKSTVVNQHIKNLDVATIVGDENNAYINYMQIVNGAIVFSKNYHVAKKLSESNEDILERAIIHIKETYDTVTTELLTNVSLKNISRSFRVAIPLKGTKRKLIDLSITNALEYKKETILKGNPEKSPLLLALQTDLHLNNYPRHIECFDNSNMQGKSAVASMVCFIDGKPSKNDYRRYHIKTVIGPDDYASMKEIVYRRYKRIMEEGGKIPNLVIVDGGKGQLSSAIESLEQLNLYGRVPIIGLAKKLEEIYFPNDPHPFYLNKRSGSLMLLQKIRNEAHRFAITFHRKTKQKTDLSSVMDKIEGVGSKTINILLQEYKSVEKIKQQSLENLSILIGEKKAQKILETLETKKGS